MQFLQTKLSKEEWCHIETPIHTSELHIIQLIKDGYYNTDISINNNMSIFTFLKIKNYENIDEYIYTYYFDKLVKDMLNKYPFINITFKNKKVNRTQTNDSNDSYIINTCNITNINIKNSDKIRINNINIDIKILKKKIYEFILIDIIHNILKYFQIKNKLWMHYYFTLFKITQNNIPNTNRIIVSIVSFVIDYFQKNNLIDTLYIIYNSHNIIEKNKLLFKYSNIQLYSHQKEIFAVSKIHTPKLILYIAPTGTGKTMTPIGLSEQHKIIFVCAARHIGLSLARTAISIHKKIAFAFGCNSTDDIRLHNFAAKEYVKNYKTGGIFKIDNSDGNKVEIIISDLFSYIHAMHYMLQFNPKENIITYWDEPTISMDYEQHELHSIIHYNWTQNIIPNVVLSSATLPKSQEIKDTLTYFYTKFENSQVFEITSHDCKKSISLIDYNGYCIMPHYLTNNYQDILTIAHNCLNNMTLLRYLDLQEITAFIKFIHENDYIIHNHHTNIQRYFDEFINIDITTIKHYYIKCLQNIQPHKWEKLHHYFNENRTIIIKDNTHTQNTHLHKLPSFENTITQTITDTDTQIKRNASEIIIKDKTNIHKQTSNNIGIFISTYDAYTLYDGPTLFITNNVNKIATFYIQQSNIPTTIIQELYSNIDFNNSIQTRIQLLEKLIEQEKCSKNENINENTKNNKNRDKDNKNIQKYNIEIQNLKLMFKKININELFIPNSKPHLEKWKPNYKDNIIDNLHNIPFTSNIDEQTIHQIMSITDINDTWKILLLMGIGVFSNHNSTNYTQIMKTLAEQQKLYLIIANSDYIYGTNYQFCHCYISKDLDLTQEKIIQALGRVGRNNIQQNYSIRFRDYQKIYTLFNFVTPLQSHLKLEVINMNRLLS